MYGLINKAVEGLVRSKFGDSAWDRIRARAGLPDEPFISMEQYDDKSTYDLVAAASVELGTPAEAILREFGRYWTVYTAKAGYGELMKNAGQSLPEFLRNLNQMHMRVKLAFPQLAPPSFAVSEETATSLTLHYYSHRPGLAPLVEGMVDGLGERFGVAVESRTERIESSKDHAAHDCLYLSWKPRVGTSV